VDYAHWAASQTPPISYSCFSTHSISFSTLMAVCEAQKIKPKKGDILFVRTGVIPEWETFSDKQKMDYATQEVPKHAGVEACIEVLEWLWDSGITAVAGDAISWEVLLTPPPGSFGDRKDSRNCRIHRSFPPQAKSRCMNTSSPGGVCQ
jgi:kynurenine formamidase